MFEKILIANRGEIACRVMRTAKRLGVKTVAVFSDADADAVHVQMADEAVHVGPPPSAQSYLQAERIIGAMKSTGAEAVHPGYGFLSENKTFAEAVAAAGKVFIGPPPGAIAAMGDKIESKRLAQKAGVNTVPGHLEPIPDADTAVKICDGIGYPVMLKASAGGGGKGMRIAWNADEAREGFRSATAEAINSFGDDRVFAEKFVDQPRHIEIQVLADGHGNTVYLGERECSVQRRHQKVLEEAPSPFLDAATRKAMGEQSVALARAVDYRSAGTVEFIVDSNRNFYFLEMNTRLQVEHPVTELITGLDLVELMLRVAAGEPLPFGQDDVTLSGWAMEARLYAEDPTRKFLPSIGRLVRYREPPEGTDELGTTRVDSGVREGSEISMFYDPMVAKLVTHAPDRAGAIDRMMDALDSYVVRGIGHNAAFLAAAMDRPRFREGRLTTGFIAEEFPDGFVPPYPDARTGARVAAVAATVYDRLMRRDALIADHAGGDDSVINTHAARAVPLGEWIVRLGDSKAPEQEWEVCVNATAGGDMSASGGGWVAEVGIDGGTSWVRSDWKPGDILFKGTIDSYPITLQIERRSLGFRIYHRGFEGDVLVLSARAATLLDRMPEKPKPDLSKFLLSPMPGLLVSLAVKAGDPVQPGQELAVVEAMKMQNVLRAENEAVVAEVLAQPGDSLAADQAILAFQ